MTGPEPTTTTWTGRLIDQFIPRPDIAERHEILIRAPADLVMEVAQSFDPPAGFAPGG